MHIDHVLYRIYPSDGTALLNVQQLPDQRDHLLGRIGANDGVSQQQLHRQRSLLPIRCYTSIFPDPFDHHYAFLVGEVQGSSNLWSSVIDRVSN